jgi:hypothetical protein
MPAESPRPRSPRQNPAATADTLLNVREEYEPASLLSANPVIFAFCQPGDWHHYIYCAIEKIHSTEDIFIYSFGFCSDHIGWNMVFLGVHDVW